MTQAKNDDQTKLTKETVEQLAIIMKFLHDQGFPLEMVKRAADAWWSTENHSEGARR